MPISHGGQTRVSPLASFTLDKLQRIHGYMTKSIEVITDAVNNPKHPFPKVDNQPKKPQKHRYERRKIKEYLHLGDWMTGGEGTVRGEATAM